MKEIIRSLRREIRQLRRRRRPLKINLIKDGLEYLAQSVFGGDGPIQKPTPESSSPVESEYSELPFDDTRDLQTSKTIVEADPSPAKVQGEGDEKPLGRQPQSKMDLMMDEKMKWEHVGTVWFGPSDRNKGGLSN